jgi:hypothetical protein
VAFLGFEGPLNTPVALFLKSDNGKRAFYTSEVSIPYIIYVMENSHFFCAPQGKLVDIKIKKRPRPLR